MAQKVEESGPRHWHHYHTSQRKLDLTESMVAAHTTYNINPNAGGCLTHRTHPPTHSESQCGGTWPQRPGKVCGRALAQSLCRGGTIRDKKGALSNDRSCPPPLPLRDKGTGRLLELKAAFTWRKLKPFPTLPVRNEPQKGQCHCGRYVSGKSNEVTLLSPLLPSNLSTVPATGEIQSKVS